MPRSKAQDHEQKRLGILSQAAYVFAENGYDRASMKQVADQIGVSKALIYHYYDSKEMLLFDILDSHLKHILSSIKDAGRSNSDPEEKLRSLIDALLASYRGADNEHRLQLESIGVLAAQQRRVLSGRQRQIVQCFSQSISCIRPDIAAGNPKRIVPITMSLLGQLNWFYLWRRPGKGISRSDYSALTADLFIGGLRSLSV